MPQEASQNFLVYIRLIPCITGAQVINQADNLSDGIIICGYKLSDNMIYTELQLHILFVPEDCGLLSPPQSLEMPQLKLTLITFPPN